MTQDHSCVLFIHVGSVFAAFSSLVYIPLIALVLAKFSFLLSYPAVPLSASRLCTVCHTVCSAHPL